MIFHNLGKLSFAINLYSRIINKKKDCVQISIKRIILHDIKYSDILNTIMNKNIIIALQLFSLYLNLQSIENRITFTFNPI